jgi:hypothetical protein
MFNGAVSSDSASFVEAGAAQETRVTFAGLWARSLVFFEATFYGLVVSGTGDAALQYYDEATAAWRTVPESILVGLNTVDRHRTEVPLCLPLQECEYRVVLRTSDTRVYLYKAAILIQPGGEDNL